jgi:hypothetical protein
MDLRGEGRFPRFMLMMVWIFLGVDLGPGAPVGFEMKLGE